MSTRRRSKLGKIPTENQVYGGWRSARLPTSWTGTVGLQWVPGDLTSVGP